MANVILPLSSLYIVSAHLHLFLNHSNPNAWTQSPDPMIILISVLYFLILNSCKIALHQWPFKVIPIYLFTLPSFSPLAHSQSEISYFSFYPLKPTFSDWLLPKLWIEGEWGFCAHSQSFMAEVTRLRICTLLDVIHVQEYKKCLKWSI